MEGPGAQGVVKACDSFFVDSPTFRVQDPSPVSTLVHGDWRGQVGGSLSRQIKGRPFGLQRESGRGRTGGPQARFYCPCV